MRGDDKMDDVVNWLTSRAALIMLVSVMVIAICTVIATFKYTR